MAASKADRWETKMSRRNFSAQLRPLDMAAAVGIALALIGPAGAATEVKPPADPIAKAAYDVLDKHCARCHQDGKLSDREKPAKNFGNVLQLDQIAADPHHIL